MKKIMICMLLLLPLIIVFSVMLAVDVISVQAYIAVESVDVVYDGKAVTSSVVEVDLEQIEMQFTGEIYPLGAKNSGFRWEIVEQSADDGTDTEVASVDANGKVSLFTFGRCKLKVTSNSEAKTAYVDLVVVGATLKSATLTLTDVIDGAIQKSEKLDVILGERVFAVPVFTPATAKITDTAFTSSDNSVLSVDGNGIVTAKALGRATVTLTANGTVSTQLNINVVAGRLDRTIYYSASSFDLAAAGFTGFSGSGTVSGTQTVETDQGAITLVPCESDDVYVEDMLYSGYTLKVGGVPAHLNARYKDYARRNETPEVVWTSGDAARATVTENGLCTAVGHGVVVLTATCGGKTAQIELTVVSPVRMIILENNAETEKGGIEETRIYGDRAILEREVTAYKTEIKVKYPADLDADNFVFSTDSSLAHFEQNSNVLVLDEVTEPTDITVKVAAKYPAYDIVPVYRTYTMRVAPGINVGSYDDLIYASGKTDGEYADIYLQSGFKITTTIELENSFFGNGFTLTAEEMRKNSDTPIVKLTRSGVTLQNVRIVGDLATNIEKSNGLSGYGVVVGNTEGARLENVAIRYCIIESCYYLVKLNKCDVLIDGCVMRNCSNFGINVVSSYIDGAEDPYNYSKLSMNNCVMSNIVAPAIGLATESFEKNDRSLGALTKQSSVTATGFLDIYNWQDITNAKMLDREIIAGNESANTAVSGLLQTLLKTQLAKPIYKNIRVDASDGAMYIHLGIISAGGLYPTTAEVVIEDPAYMMKYDLLGTVKDIADLSSLDACYLYMYGSDAAIRPEDEVEFNKELYQRLRG